MEAKMNESRATRHAARLYVEELEPRVAPVTLSGTATYGFTDGNGDLVRVSLAGAGASPEVTILDATGGDPANTDIATVTFARGNANTVLTIEVIGGTGDGQTPAGDINSGNRKIGSIQVQGDISSFTGASITTLASDYNGASGSIGDVALTSSFSGTIRSGGDLGNVTVGGATGISASAVITAPGILRGWISASSGTNDATINVGGLETVTASDVEWYGNGALQWSGTNAGVRLLISKNLSYVETQNWPDRIYFTGQFHAGTDPNENIQGYWAAAPWGLVMDGWRLVITTSGGTGFVPGNDGFHTELSFGMDFSLTPNFDLAVFDAIDAAQKTSDKYHFSIYVPTGTAPSPLILTGEIVIPDGGTLGSVLHRDPVFEDADGIASAETAHPTPLERAVQREAWGMLYRYETRTDLGASSDGLQSHDVVLPSLPSTVTTDGPDSPGFVGPLPANTSPEDAGVSRHTGLVPVLGEEIGRPEAVVGGVEPDPIATPFTNVIAAAPLG